MPEFSTIQSRLPSLLGVNSINLIRMQRTKSVWLMTFKETLETNNVSIHPRIWEFLTHYLGDRTTFLFGDRDAYLFIVVFFPIASLSAPPVYIHSTNLNQQILNYIYSGNNWEKSHSGYVYLSAPHIINTNLHQLWN